jgi:hypothetical protein
MPITAQTDLGKGRSMADDPTQFGQGHESPDNEQGDWSADDEQALFGAHTPSTWSQDSPPPAGASWTESEDSPPDDWGHLIAPEEVPGEGDVHEALAAEPPESLDGPTPPVPGSSDLTAAAAGEEITSVLLAAEQAARRIVERAQETARQQMAEVGRQRRQLEDDAVRLAAWREQIASVIPPMAKEIEEFRVRLEDIPQRLSQAFALLAERVPSIQQDLEELASGLGSSAPLSTQGSREERQRLTG